MYNDNKYFSYTRRCIMTTNIIIRKCIFSLYEVICNDNIYLSLYKKMYRNINIFVIHESIFLIIQDDV